MIRVLLMYLNCNLCLLTALSAPINDYKESNLNHCQVSDVFCCLTAVFIDFALLFSLLFTLPIKSLPTSSYNVYRTQAWRQPV